MDNKKKLTIIIAVLAVVCFFAVLVFSGVIDFGSIGSEETSTDEADANLDTDEYPLSLSALVQSDVSYLETNIDGIFYTMTEDGTVTFYSYDSTANSFTETAATGTYDVTVEMSEQSISATVTYYKDGTDIAGYGLYTGSEGEYNLYSYAFFRLTNYGADYSSSSDGCLLLVDTTEDDFYSNDKVYEEPFAFYYSSQSATRLLSEANRTVGLDGTKRADYSMLNDVVINASHSQMLFFSGRHYSEDDERVDLLRSGGSGNNVDNVLLISDVLGYWIEYTDEGIKYISVDDSDNVFVGLYNMSSDTTETLKTFEGITRDDVLVSNGYIYIISTNTVYSIDGDTEVTLVYDNVSGLEVDLFKATADVFVVRGYVNTNSPVFISASTSTGSVIKSFCNSDFANLVNPVITDVSGAMFTIVDGSKFTCYVM